MKVAILDDLHNTLIRFPVSLSLTLSTSMSGPITRKTRAYSPDGW